MLHVKVPDDLAEPRQNAARAFIAALRDDKKKPGINRGEGGQFSAESRAHGPIAFEILEAFFDLG